MSTLKEGAMIQSFETKLNQTPKRKATSSHNIVILLLISTATILLSALPGSASASANVSQTPSIGYAHLLLFNTSSLNKPLK